MIKYMKNEESVIYKGIESSYIDTNKLNGRNVVIDEQDINVTELVADMIKECQNQQNIKITEDSSLEDIAMDSLGFVRLIVGLEEKFAIEFEENMLLLNKYDKVKDLVEYIICLVRKKEK